MYLYFRGHSTFYCDNYSLFCQLQSKMYFSQKMLDVTYLLFVIRQLTYKLETKTPTFKN